MRNAEEYKIMHVKLQAHEDLLWLKEKSGKPMTEIVAALARAAREGMEEKGCVTAPV